MPPKPHAAEVSPCWQLPLASQQPFGQVDPLHSPHAPPSQPTTSQNPPLHTLEGPQTAQVDPSWPQSPWPKPSWQFPEASQHPPHVSGPHDCGSWHPPPTHSPLGPHEAHCWPPSPHACELEPETQLSPRQHPPQLSGVQVAEGPQMPCGRHVSPRFWQFWQTTPPVPHACALTPEMHVWPSGVLVQHPSAQVDALHTVMVTWQECVTALHDESPPGLTHEAHVRPPAPHSRSAVPGSQRFASSQQPPAHVSGPQPVVVPQVREARLHTSPPTHVAQIAPRVPQSAATVPVWHVPSPSQQPPGHVAGPHGRLPSRGTLPSRPPYGRMADRSPQPTRSSSRTHEAQSGRSARRAVERSSARKVIGCPKGSEVGTDGTW
jgi:hypothetical protein